MYAYYKDYDDSCVRTGTDGGPLDLDVMGIGDEDAVGVGAVAGRRNEDPVNENAVTSVKCHMLAWTVLQVYSFYPEIIAHQESNYLYI